ncbi:uncharacterized protein DS421_7g213570 [Arachis hypogaea]|nr:uncharacterized protein DS421_7g213570 [Arachis hypogaea]
MFFLRIVAAGVTEIATASPNVATVAVDLSQFKVVSVFNSIKFDVAASVIGVGNAAIISQLGQHHPRCSDSNFPNFETPLWLPFYATIRSCIYVDAALGQELLKL